MFPVRAKNSERERSESNRCPNPHARQKHDTTRAAKKLSFWPQHWTFQDIQATRQADPDVRSS
jgi:hypothetical protein